MSNECGPAVLRSASYLALEEHCEGYPIALYTGAGVPWSSDPKYGIGGWDDLEWRVLVERDGVNSAVVTEFGQRVA